MLSPDECQTKSFEKMNTLLSAIFKQKNLSVFFKCCPRTYDFVLKNHLIHKFFRSEIFTDGHIINLNRKKIKLTSHANLSL